MRKQLAIVGLGAGLIGGGAAGFAFTGTSVVAGAQSESTTTVAEADAGNSSDEAATDQAAADQAKPEAGAKIAEALAGLVEDGTLTQAQLDTVVETLKEAMPERGNRNGHGPGGVHRGNGGEVLATALGITTDELKTEFQSGKTIAEIAADNGVELSTVSAALVQEEQDHLDERVADGDITQEEADARLEGAEERITARLNGERPERGDRSERGLRRGQLGDDANEAPSTTVPSSTEG